MHLPDFKVYWLTIAAVKTVIGFHIFDKFFLIFEKKKSVNSFYNHFFFDYPNQNFQQFELDMNQCLKKWTYLMPD